jgi:capsid protein
MGLLTWIRNAIGPRRSRRPPVEAPLFARPVRGRYDAAGNGLETKNVWTNAVDALDADAAHSLGVRKRLRERSREEQANNGYADGILGTNANYVIGLGPKLRMETGSPGFNTLVESRWNQWCTASGLMRKLRTLQRAKDGDGEGFGVCKTNPMLRNPVQLDVQLVECDQVSTPFLAWGVPGKIDGLTFDEFGNVVDYDVLPYHPGGLWWAPIVDPTKYPAEYVLHLFAGKRSGQHRGVPTASPTLNLFATGRRYREAVVGAAETAADFAAVVQMGAPSEGPDEVRPYSSVPIEKRMLVATPAGSTGITQLRAEQPTTTYPDFVDTQIAEEARPFHMPRNIAACDSSGYSFSGGQLDHLTFFVAVDIERADCEELVLNKLFALWFAEAVDVYGWSVPADAAPAHSWQWPARPQIDVEKTANARKVSLSCGATTLSRIYAEDGFDFEEELVVMARDFGVPTAEMRKVLMDAVFNRQGAAASPPPTRTPPETPSPARMNGRGRMAFRA